eukprot:TRINITY_DN5872_c0_g2_i1.p1 TRINITY_DN5872_c0_g2~~TRINITY_DN5872_c0_g2_i1.p1  ORF type:complete len:646 (+),score=213.62 TRINITY_DN5872_c0_g2_i1:86-2023(+)
MARGQPAWRDPAHDAGAAGRAGAPAPEAARAMEHLRCQYPEEVPRVVERLYRESPAAEVCQYRLDCREHRRRDPARAAADRAAAAARVIGSPPSSSPPSAANTPPTPQPTVAPVSAAVAAAGAAEGRPLPSCEYCGKQFRRFDLSQHRLEAHADQLRSLEQLREEMHQWKASQWRAAHQHFYHALSIHMPIWGGELWGIVGPRAETAASALDRRLVVREVRQLMEAVRERAQMYLFGSGVSGLAEAWSDVDIAGLLESKTRRPACDAPPEEVQVLERFHERLVDPLQKHPWPGARETSPEPGVGLKAVLRTKVPIVQCCVGTQAEFTRDEHRKKKAKTLLFTAPEDVSPAALEHIREARGAESVKAVQWGRRGQVLLVEYPTEHDAVTAKDAVGPEAQFAYQDKPYAVPLVYLRQWDLSLRLYGVRNSHLLRRYFVDTPCSQFRIAGIAVKIWARTQGINDPRKGMLSSYAVTLMYLYYLLRADKVSWIDPETVDLADCMPVPGLEPIEAPDEVTLAQAAESFVGFLYYYTHEFKWHCEVISVSRGARKQLQELVPVLQKELGWTVENNTIVDRGNCVRYFLRIEDPYEAADPLPSGDPGRGKLNVGRKITEHSMLQIRQCFTRSWQLLCQSGSVAALFERTVRV